MAMSSAGLKVRGLIRFARSRKGASIDGNADGADHLAPIGHVAFELVRRLGVRLEDRVEADGLEPLLRLRLFQDLIDFGIELGYHRVGCFRRREKSDPGAGINV